MTSLTPDRSSPATAADEAFQADVECLIALIAHGAAQTTAYNLADIDTQACIREAERRYRNALAHYRQAGHLSLETPSQRNDLHGAVSTTGGPSGAPWRRLRRVLARVPGDAPHRVPASPAQAALHLGSLRGGAIALRAVLNEARPHLFDGLDDPVRRLEDLLQTIAGQTTVHNLPSTQRPAHTMTDTDASRSSAALALAQDAFDEGDHEWQLARTAAVSHASRRSGHITSPDGRKELAEGRSAVMTSGTGTPRPADQAYARAEHHYLDAASLYHTGQPRSSHETTAGTIDRLPNPVREVFRALQRDYLRDAAGTPGAHTRDAYLSRLRDELVAQAPQVFGSRESPVGDDRPTR